MLRVALLLMRLMLVAEQRSIGRQCRRRYQGLGDRGVHGQARTETNELAGGRARKKAPGTSSSHDT